MDLFSPIICILQLAYRRLFCVWPSIISWSWQEILLTLTTMEKSSSSDGDHEPKRWNGTKAHDTHFTPSEPMPIAVVGMACRFPGEAANGKGLWDMCCEGRSAWSEIPQSRMNSEAFWPPDPSKTGGVSRSVSIWPLKHIDMKNQFNARGAHFLKEDVALFDAPFFNISPYEAKVMNPSRTR